MSYIILFSGVPGWRYLSAFTPLSFPFRSYSVFINILGSVYLYLSVLLIVAESTVSMIYVCTVWATLSALLLWRSVSSAYRTLWVTFSTRGGVFSFFRAWYLKRTLSLATTYTDYVAARAAYNLQFPGSPGPFLIEHGCPPAQDAHSAALQRELVAARVAASGFSLMHGLHAALSHELLHSSESSTLRLEICRSLLALADPIQMGPSFAEKSEFFKDVRLSVGRTVLCLSPGGSFTISYFGVVEELRKMHLLPRVLSACGAGALVGAVVAVLTDRELEELAREPARLVGPVPLRERFALHLAGPPPALCPAESALSKRGLEPLLIDFLGDNSKWRLAAALGFPATASGLWYGAKIPVDEGAMNALLRNQFGDETFASAFKKTGRVLCVTVWQGHDSGVSGSRYALSFVTCPHVLLYSAVAKSCEPWQGGASGPLLQLSAAGVKEPFPLDGLPSERCATPSDGVEDPPHFFHAKRVVCVSLREDAWDAISRDTNAAEFRAIWPAATEAPLPDASGFSPHAELNRILRFLRDDIFSRFDHLCTKGLIPRHLGRNFVTSVLTAPTTPRSWQLNDAGRVLILPKSAAGLGATPPFIFQVPHSEEANAHVLHGAQATWPFLQRISAMSIVERACAECCAQVVPPTRTHTRASPHASPSSHPTLPTIPHPHSRTHLLPGVSRSPCQDYRPPWGGERCLNNTARRRKAASRRRAGRSDHQMTSFRSFPRWRRAQRARLRALKRPQPPAARAAKAARPRLRALQASRQARPFPSIPGRRRPLPALHNLSTKSQAGPT